MAVEWSVTIEGKNEFGDVCRREVRITKSWERLFDGDIGLSIDDGKTIMAALQGAVVAHEAETYSLFRRVCPDCHTFRPVKDYTVRRIRTVFGTVEVRNPRWMLCKDCHPGMVAAFAPLKEICPDRATPELMELTARLGSMLPYRQAASVLGQFLPIEPTETHATVRKRTIRIGERLDDQIAEEEWRARTTTAVIEERRQFEMQLPGDRRKEFVISIDTAHVRSADPISARNFELVVARCGRGGRGDVGGRYFVTSSTDQTAIRERAFHALQREGYCGFGDITVISDGAEILKRLPRAMPKPTAHIIDWFHIAMKIQPMQQIADHMTRSRSGPFEALPSIDRDIRAVKWRLWHGRVDRAIRDLEHLLARLKDPQRDGEFSIARLHSLGSQLLTYVRSNRGAIVNYGKRYRAGLRVATTLAESAVNSLVGKRMVKKQQMRWSLRGAHMLMQVRTADLNGELRDRLRAPFRQPEPNVPPLFYRAALLWTIDMISASYHAIRLQHACGSRSRTVVSHGQDEKGEQWFKMDRSKNPARPAPRVSRSMPIEYFILANLRCEGPIIGHLASHRIHETVVDERGTRYRYVGLVGRDVDGRFDVNSLQPGEWIVQPGLIYAIQQPNPQSHT